MSGALRRRSRWLAAFVGLGLASGMPAAAQTVPAEAAPANWVRYAAGATAAISQWLQADDEAALRLRAYLDAARTAPDQPGAPLLLKVWVDPDSRVTRLEFAPFEHPEPGADLRSLILGRQLPGSPPRDMRLPLRIAVQLEPAPVQGNP